MSIFTNIEESNNTLNTVLSLLSVYDKVMVLKLFVDYDDENHLYDMYRVAAQNHNNLVLDQLSHIDAGFDLFAPLIDGQNTTNNSIVFSAPNTRYNDYSQVNKLDFKICCSARMHTDTGKDYNTGYYMYPRSSLSKTSLRLANSTGIIDAGYRGHLIGMFDVVNSPYDYFGAKYDRYLQICAPGLVPIVVEVVDTKEELGSETVRGGGGFGSTGR